METKKLMELSVLRLFKDELIGNNEQLTELELLDELNLSEEQAYSLGDCASIAMGALWE